MSVRRSFIILFFLIANVMKYLAFFFTLTWVLSACSAEFPADDPSPSDDLFAAFDKTVCLAVYQEQGCSCYESYVQETFGEFGTPLLRDVSPNGDELNLNEFEGLFDDYPTQFFYYDSTSTRQVRDIVLLVYSSEYFGYLDGLVTKLPERESEVLSAYLEQLRSDEFTTVFARNSFMDYLLEDPECSKDLLKVIIVDYLLYKHLYI